MTIKDPFPTTRRLDQVEDLFSRPGTWTQGAGARDEHGAPCPANDHRAVCWCLTGAFSIHPLTAIERMAVVSATLDLSQGVIGSVLAYNDAEGRTQSDILALVRLAKTRVRLRKTPGLRPATPFSEPAP